MSQGRIGVAWIVRAAKWQNRATAKGASIVTEKKAKPAAADRKELNRIRRRVNDPSYYGEVIDGVHTWDAGKIFTDFRATIQIARRALKRSEAASL